MKGMLGRKVSIIAIAAFAGLIGVGAAFLVLPGLAPIIGIGSAMDAGKEPSPAAAKSEEGSHGPGMMYPMKERIINLADSGAFHYLKIELALEFDLPEAKGLTGDAYKKSQEEFIKTMASRRPILDDIVTTTMASKTSASLATSEGKETLREELKSRFGGVVGEHKLVTVYFTQFIVQ